MISEMGLKLFLLLIVIVVAKQQFAYTIRYSKSYSPSKVPQNMGCSQKNVVYGNYIYPQGPVDVLYFLLNPHTYNVWLQCKNEKVFVKVFGTSQDYEVILKTEPKTVANNLRGAVNMDNFIIDWKYPPTKNYSTSKEWLNAFVLALTNFNKTVYVKAPASSFCYQNEVDKETYLVTNQTNASLIIEMHGQEAGQYTTYDQIFGNPDQIKNIEVCGKAPSYQQLVKLFPNKDFYIEKTLLKEEAGYIGSNLQRFLAKAQPIYGKILFLDSYQRQIIDL